MNNIVFLFLRRMRRPLLTLILVYTVAVVGLTQIPGQDDAGQEHYLSIFHAFYFVSFMSTTIGFGEIPYAFTDVQRMWVTTSLYAAVVSWIYALGSILSLVQDATFQRALHERMFAARIKRQREPFFLICGYGETGQALTQALTDRGRHVVVIDRDPKRVAMVQLLNLRDYVPALSGDLRKPYHLQEAGLTHPRCAGVVAVTDSNETNLKVAITSKLLNPRVPVVCRADSSPVEANMASFGTDHIVDPYETFSTYLATAFRQPCLYLLQRWLGSEEESQLEEPIYPPKHAHWVVCRYGRFGKAMVMRLRNEGLDVKVIEASPEITGEPPPGYVHGVGTEADTLLQADIETAAGLVAGTQDDANNLSIVMTAREINPDLFVVVRQNRSMNQAIIDAVGADMVMHPSAIIAERIRILLATPMLYRFSDRAMRQDDAWACQLVSRIAAVVQQAVPEVVELHIDVEVGAAVCQLAEGGGEVYVGELMNDPWQPARNLNCILLMIRREEECLLVPEADVALKPGDRLLACGDRRGLSRLRWNLCHAAALSHVRGDGTQPQGWFWRRLVALRGRGQ